MMQPYLERSVTNSPSLESSRMRQERSQVREPIPGLLDTQSITKLGPNAKQTESSLMVKFAITLYKSGVLLGMVPQNL